MKLLTKIHAQAHHKAVFGRRIDVLSRQISERLPRDSRILDVGCGSGDLASRIMALRPDVRIEGIDVLVRPDTSIPVRQFDGHSIPFSDGEFDIVLFVDVLHHTDDPVSLLREARRVSSKGLLIKDHNRDGFLAGPTLRFMDWVGNAAHGVRLPYNYLSDKEWRAAWANTGLQVRDHIGSLGLYPRPFGWFFDRQLHFVAHLV